MYCRRSYHSLLSWVRRNLGRSHRSGATLGFSIVWRKVDDVYVSHCSLFYMYCIYVYHRRLYHDYCTVVSTSQSEMISLAQRLQFEWSGEITEDKAECFCALYSMATTA